MKRKRQSELDQGNTEKAQRLDNNHPDRKQRGSIPIHRGKFKNRFLQKHASLLYYDADMASTNGLLVTTGASTETRAMGQIGQFLDSWMSKLFPNHHVLQTRQRPQPLPIEHLQTPDCNDDAKQIIEQKARPFYAVDTACSGVLFMRFNVSISPLQFVLGIFEQYEPSATEEWEKLQRSISHCFRLLPIDCVCRATISDISSTLPPILESHKALLENAESVAIVVEIRNNPTVSRNAVIDAVAPLIPPSMHINLHTPDVVILVSVFKSCCGLGVLKGYHAHKKYNIQELGKPLPATDDVQTQ